MDTNRPLGSLAQAAVEQFGDLAKRAVARAVEHRGGRDLAAGGRQIVGHVFSERELEDQPLKPGNWLTVGIVREGTTTTLVEINVGTWETREVVASVVRHAGDTLASPSFDPAVAVASSQ
jgi:hypothetical protein